MKPDLEKAKTLRKMLRKIDPNWRCYTDDYLGMIDDKTFNEIARQYSAIKEANRTVNRFFLLACGFGLFWN